MVVMVALRKWSVTRLVCFTTIIIRKGNRLYGAYFDSQNEYKAVVFDSIGKYYSLGMDAFSMEIIMRMVPRQDGTYNGNNWDRILGKAGWGLYRQRGTVSMRTNPKEGPALEQAITG